MKQVSKDVDAKLSGQPKLVNSDRKLLLAVWSAQGLRLTKEQRAIFLNDCYSAESITRARRHLQGKYFSSMEPAVMRARRIKESQYRQAFSSRITKKPLHKIDGIDMLEE